MPVKRETYLVEQYRPGLGRIGLERLVANMGLALGRLEHDGVPIRLVRTVVVPADEAILTLVEASSEELVREAYARAGAPIERISTAIDHGGRQ